MTREEIMLWLEHLANRETVPECREALETASWIIYGCPEDVVKSYSAVVANWKNKDFSISKNDFCSFWSDVKGGAENEKTI